jgi:pilus assembly protein CpaF
VTTTTATFSATLTAPMAQLRGRVHARLIDELRERPDDTQLRAEIDRLVRDEAPFLPVAERFELIEMLVHEVVGLGPFDALLDLPDVSDILVNGPGSCFVERNGRLEPIAFDLDASALERIAQRIVAPLGLRLDRASPMVDARLGDGSRVHVVLPPLAPDGPCIAIRRFAARAVDLVDFGLSGAAHSLLLDAVRSGRNVVVAGGTGAGKTTLLNAIAREIDPGERVVTIEETAELRLAHPHVVRLEARPANAEGVGEVAVRDLVRAALRMRPDRLVIGEVRAGEALDLLQAMNTGHDGSLSTVHANSAADALARLETLALFAASGLPVEAIRRQLATAVDLVVFVARRAGRRRVTGIVEVGPAPIDDRPIATNELVMYDGADLRVVGEPRRPARRAADPSAPSC